MKAKLNSIFRSISGSLDGEHYCQMRNGKVVVYRKPRSRKGPQGGTVRNNVLFAQCSRLAGYLLNDERQRAYWQEEMDLWNAQFPRNWEAAESSRVSRRERHPYVFLRQFVMARLMRVMKG